MIEFKNKSSTFHNIQKYDDWTVPPDYLFEMVDCPNVAEFQYRIDGIVYTEQTEEFKAAWKKAKFWLDLQK